MSIVQLYIAGDESYEVANRVLANDLPNIDLCDEDERETFVDECRWALGQKVRTVALMHAFRENKDGEMQSLEELCIAARAKITNASFMMSVQEFVLGDLKVSEQVELHPNIQGVMAETLQTYKKIMKALGLNIGKGLPATKKRQQSITIDPIDLKPLDKRDELGDGHSLSA